MIQYWRQIGGVAIVLFLLACGQKQDEGVWVPMEYQLDENRIYQDVAFLASDPLEGREIGTPGNELALDHLEKIFSDLALAPASPSREGYRDPFSMWLWKMVGAPRMVLGEKTLIPGEEFQVPRYSGSATLSTELVFAGHGISIPPFDKKDFPDCPFDSQTGYDDYQGLDVSGKVVVVGNSGFSKFQDRLDACPLPSDCPVFRPCLWQYDYKVDNAFAHNAAAVIFVSSSQKYPYPIFGINIAPEDTHQDMPVLSAHRDRIKEVIPDLDTLLTEIDETIQPQGRSTGVTLSLEVKAEFAYRSAYNLLGVVRGMDPQLAQEVVVITAHPDHVGRDAITGEILPGADDNASGVGVMLELARLLRSQQDPPARTVLFASFNSEELWLYGSCGYVQNPAIPIANTKAVFSIDCVGAGTGGGLLVMGGTHPQNAALTRLMQSTAASAGQEGKIVPMLYIPNSDHACFFREGVPAVMVMSAALHENAHTPQDNLDAINKADLKLSTELMWETLRAMAQGYDQF